MRLLIAFTLAFLYAAPLWLNAQEKPLHYIWHRKGVPIYNEPSAQTVLDSLSYGTEVNIIEERNKGKTEHSAAVVRLPMRTESDFLLPT